MRLKSREEVRQTSRSLSGASGGKENRLMRESLMEYQDEAFRHGVDRTNDRLREASPSIKKLKGPWNRPH